MADEQGLPALVGAIEEIGAVAADLAEAARGLNGPELQEPRATAMAIADAAALLTRTHAPEPGIDIADALAGVAANLARLSLPAKDSVLGRSSSLRDLRAEVGLLERALREGLAAAAASGRLPRAVAFRAPPDTAVRAGAGHEEFRALDARLGQVEAKLQGLAQTAQTINNVKQQGLINLTVGAINLQVLIGRLNLGGKSGKIDLAGLARAVAAMADLLGNLLEAVRGWAGPVVAAVTAATLAVSGPVKRLVQGMRAQTGWLWRAAVRRGWGEDALGETADLGEPPDAFDLDLVHAMIVAGEAPPATWEPFITALDFSPEFTAGERKRPAGAEGLADLRPLAGLTGLKRLNLWDTQVSNIEGLAGLTGLQYLDLTGTLVSDIGELAGLTGLQRLDLRNTLVIDVSPLARIKGLRVLMPDGSPRQF